MKRLIAIMIICVLAITVAIGEGQSRAEWYEQGIEALYSFDHDIIEMARGFFNRAGTYAYAQSF